MKNEPVVKLLAEIRIKRKFAAFDPFAHSCARNALPACDMGMCSISVIEFLLMLADFRCRLRDLTWSYSGLPL